jgi:Dolichyl-phosphate-mannose-protein mannosyltransferase
MSLLYLALFCFAGFSLLRFFFPGELRVSVHNALLVSLGAGLGLGIASALYFLCIAAVGPKIAVLAVVEGAFVVGAAVLGLRKKPSGQELTWFGSAATPVYLTALLGVAGVLGLIFFVTHSATKPHGEWDAWAIWNLHARFLYRSGDLWQHAFSPQLSWSHPDYPVLLPGLIALCWTLSGAESTLAPIGVAFIFTFATAGVVICALGVLRGRSQAWIAGALLVGTVEFVEVGAMQYADVPLSFFLLAAIALLCLQDRDSDNLHFTALAGLAAGFAAWTKNEGLLFVIAVVVARLFAMVRFKSGPPLVKQLGAMAGGLAFPLAVVTFFKLRFAPANDLASATLPDMVKHAADFGRWMTVLVAFGKEALRFGDLAVQGEMVQGFLIPISLVLVVYWFLVRFHVEERDRPSVATAALAAGLMLAGDFAVYMLLPNDVAWQLNTSLDRIFLQLWPLGLFAFFLAANAPQLAAKPVAEKAKPVRQTSKGQRKAAQTR